MFFEVLLHAKIAANNNKKNENKMPKFSLPAVAVRAAACFTVARFAEPKVRQEMASWDFFSVAGGEPLFDAWQDGFYKSSALQYIVNNCLPGGTVPSQPTSSYSSFDNFMPPLSVQRTIVALATSSLLIGPATAPVAIFDQAKKAGRAPVVTLPIIMAIALSNIRNSTARSAVSVGGKNVKSGLEVDAELAVVSSASEAAASPSIRTSFISTSMFVTAGVAFLDTALAGMTNKLKMDALNGVAPSSARSISERLSRAGAVLRAAPVASSVRFLSSGVSAGLFLAVQPKVEHALEESGCSKGTATGVAVFMTSFFASIIKNPTSVIEKIMLDMASRSPDFSRSLVTAAQQAVKLHGPRMCVVGLGSTLLMNCMVFGGLTVGGKFAEYLIPDEALEQGLEAERGPERPSL